MRPGLAGEGDPPASPVLFSWLVAALAGRDLFFQDLHVLSGWGLRPQLVYTPVVKLFRFDGVDATLGRGAGATNVGVML